MNTNIKAYVDRYYISASDLQGFYGWHIETCWKYLRKLRKDLGKKPKSRVTIEEFALYGNLSLDMVRKFKEDQIKG